MIGRGTCRGGAGGAVKGRLHSVCGRSPAHGRPVGVPTEAQAGSARCHRHALRRRALNRCYIAVHITVDITVENFVDRDCLFQSVGAPELLGPE